MEWTKGKMIVAVGAIFIWSSILSLIGVLSGAKRPWEVILSLGVLIPAIILAISGAVIITYGLRVRHSEKLEAPQVTNIRCETCGALIDTRAGRKWATGSATTIFGIPISMGYRERITAKCPVCGAKAKLKKPVEEVWPPPAAVPTLTLRCPQCKSTFKVESKEKPFKVKCPSCGKEGMMR
ncbi:MAG: hypothetical protein QME47_06135 [Candidatus Thermoplasmatota archaeon]|nr:hypothetical protein [Candidatus Thermoplasmatota archaeon]